MPLFQEDNGNIVRHGREIVHLSEDSFKSLIVNKKKCLICGHHAKRNKEHVIPDWIIRRCDLEEDKINLPGGLSHRFTTYTIPICIACNSDLGVKLEEPVAQAFSEGYAAVKYLADQNDATLYSWAVYLYLKTHYKDLFVEKYDRRSKSAINLATNLDWTRLRNTHALVRANVLGSAIRPSAVGSMRVLRICDVERYAKFNYKDCFDDSTVYVRIDNIALIFNVNDLGACDYYLHEFQSELPEEVSQVQSIALLNEYELAARRLYGRWNLSQDIYLADGSAELIGVVIEKLGVRPSEEQFRRDGLIYHLTPFLLQTGVAPAVAQVIFDGIASGALEYLPRKAQQPLRAEAFAQDWQGRRHERRRAVTSRLAHCPASKR